MSQLEDNYESRTAFDTSKPQLIKKRKRYKYRVENRDWNATQFWRKSRLKKSHNLTRYSQYFDKKDRSKLFSWRFVDALSEDLKINPYDADYLLQVMGAIIRRQLVRGEIVGIPGVGYFHIKQKKVRDNSYNRCKKVAHPTIPGEKITMAEAVGDNATGEQEFTVNRVAFSFTSTLRRKGYVKAHDVKEVEKSERNKLDEIRKSIPDRQPTEANGRRREFSRGVYHARGKIAGRS